MHVKKIISIIITSILSLIVAGLLIILIKNTIALKNNQKLHLMARLNEKLIPYQNENLSKFAEQYKK